MNKVLISGYERVSRRTAEKLYNAGESLRIVPCKYRPDTLMSLSLSIGHEFSALVNSFMYYNCNWETGYYPAFYRKVVQ